ncbi:uncharacterized protein FFNC_15582 [Fusarium fujikuroi]|nr:uncharacterized protein FFNC_15582 [Fusarium fujikuroi]
MRTSKKERLARLSYRKDVAESILQGRKLSDVHPLDLLGLKDDWSPISGCTGPSLSEWKKPKQKKKDELVAFRRSLGKRYSHLAAACKDDNDRLLLLNNAKIYLESEAEFRLRFWLTVGGHDKDATTRWPHCNNPKCSNTAQTAEGPDGCKITMESVWDSGTPDAKGKASAENAISISSDSSSQSGSDSESTASGPLLACMCGESRKTIRLLFKHGRQCERVSDSARARCISVDRDKCLYGCAIKATNATRSDHEKRRHYICQGCGAITTKRQAHKFASLKHINPVDFFLRPEKDFEKRNPYQVIKEALMSIPPCEAEGVAKLNDAQLVSVIRSALEQWAALVITSQESPGSMNEGLGSQQDAPVTGPDPENETENSDNLVRLLESNTPASPVPQGPLISADSPTVAQSDCIISGPVEIVDRAQASSPVECPSPSFALLVNLHSAPALPPEDGTSQPLYSRNDGTQAKKPRLGQGSPADGHTSVMCVTQRDKVGNGTIIAPSLGSSDHRHALESDIARALEIEADCPTDYTSSEDTEQAGAYTTRGTEVSTAGPSTTIPLAYHTEPPSRHQLSTDATTFSQYMYTTAQEVNFVCQYEDMSPFLPVLTATAGHASDLVDGGQEISVFGNSQCVSKDDAPTNHNVPEDIDAEIKRICRLNNLEPSVTGTYSDNTIIWLIDSQKGLSELAKSPKYKYEEAILRKRCRPGYVHIQSHMFKGAR